MDATQSPKWAAYAAAHAAAAQAAPGAARTAALKTLDQKRAELVADLGQVQSARMAAIES